MPRKHTPAELAEANRLLKEARPLLEQMNEEERKENAVWLKEIALLEERPKREWEEVNLGNGETIRIRSCLTESEARRVDELIAAIKAGDRDKLYTIIEMATVNPYITEEYLRENQDKWSVRDMLKIVKGFYQTILGEIETERDRVNQAETFRKDEGGS